MRFLLVGKKWEELEFQMQIQRDDIIGIKCQVAEQLENWNLVMDGCKLCKRLGKKREMRVALYVKEQLESMGFMCEGFDSM